MWELQKPSLEGGGIKKEWRFISFATEEDYTLAEIEQKRKDMTGTVMAVGNSLTWTWMLPSPRHE